MIAQLRDILIATRIWALREDRMAVAGTMVRRAIPVTKLSVRV